ncbi:heterokaryon incompatibility protein-domain-containing protein [Xylaria cf. heliscus]|nr:heterokaryon incompatibility protein-domain-containing protein [Xylaria cf. heliscus]
MRLLNVKTGVLEEILNPSTHKYAILSHMWEDEEVSFSDMNNPSFKAKGGYKKIKMAMKLADEAGLHYVWIDTCCIDKSSSAELTEAINSMYRWYERSDVCYAYLSDLPSHLPLTMSLRHSRWFTRGWTLQELIAPKTVYFFDSHWNKRGTKEDFIEELSKITKISKYVLGHEQPLSTATVAQKMSWAAGRKTTRVEDQAYCLLGIFDVNMPLLYGEEEKAFRRLQYEIIGRTADLSIFAWCLSPPPAEVARDKERVYCGILAASPDVFAGCTTLSKIPHRMYREFSVSNIGIRTKIHVLSYPVPGKRGAYSYVLPLDCVPDSSTSLGIRLRKCGPDIFVREDPWTLFQYRKALEPNVPRARYVLIEMPEPDLQKGLYQICSNQSFVRMRPHGLQIQLPPKLELFDVWPWSRYDEEDNMFLVSAEGRYDSGAIRLRGTLETQHDGSTTRVDIDYMFYVLGWASSDPNSLQYSFVDYGTYKDAVNELQTVLNSGDHSRGQLLYEIKKAGIPRFREATKKIPETNLAIHFSVEHTWHRDDSICSNSFWRFTFSYKVCEAEPDIEPLEWILVNRSHEEEERAWTSLRDEYEF